MKLFKKSPLDITATFLTPQTTRNDYTLFAYLQDIKGMVCNLPQKTVANKAKRWHLLSTHFLLYLQEKFKYLVKIPEYRNRGLPSKSGGEETALQLHFENLESVNDQTQLTDSCLQKQQADTPPEIANDPDRTLVSKANAFDHPAHDKIQPNRYLSNNALAGQTILCVGGRAALYPEYRRLITSLGARLLIYRGSLESNINHLYIHLENADMVICPIDCINHNDFFAVKFYCKFSGKPYTLLNRSNLTTFHTGLKTLTRLACQHACLPNGHNQAASIQ